MNIDIAALNALVGQGWLKRREYGEFVVWDYTQKTQAMRHWTPETRMCRGLVTTRDGRIVSRPFPKFFNLGEEPLPEGLGQPLVYEKVDGSLIVVSQFEGQRIVSSRASMGNPHTRAAEDILGDWMPEPGFTYCFELIHPDMRIVCHYGDARELRLLAKIDARTGVEYRLPPPPQVLDWPNQAVEYQMMWPFDPEDHAVPNAEGFVLFWPGWALRVKVKFAEYLRLHKLLAGVTPRTIWDMLRRGQATDELYKRTPDEFYDWLQEHEESLKRRYRSILIQGVNRIDHLKHLERKGFAAAIADDPLRSVLFKLYDDRDPAPVIWQMLEPKNTRAFWGTSEG